MYVLDSSAVEKLYYSLKQGTYLYLLLCYYGPFDSQWLLPAVCHLFVQAKHFKENLNSVNLKYNFIIIIH